MFINNTKNIKNMNNNKTKQMIQKIEDYLFSLSEKEKIDLYTKYSDILKYNKKKGYDLYQTTERDFSSFYNDDTGESNVNDLYNRFEEDDEKLLLLRDFNYNDDTGYDSDINKSNVIFTMKEIVDSLYSNENSNLHSKIMILFSYTTSYTKGVDYFHKEIFHYHDLDEYLPAFKPLKI